MPETSSFPRARGVEYQCCGATHRGPEDLSPWVTCPRCRHTYRIHLTRVRGGPSRYPPGTRLRVRRDGVVRVVGREVAVIGGSTLVVGYDATGYLGCPAGEVLVGVEVVGADGTPLRLLGTVPEDLVVDDATGVSLGGPPGSEATGSNPEGGVTRGEVEGGAGAYGGSGGG
jgi:hypothetical protein